MIFETLQYIDNIERNGSEGGARRFEYEWNTGPTLCVIFLIAVASIKSCCSASIAHQVFVDRLPFLRYRALHFLHNI